MDLRLRFAGMRRRLELAEAAAPQRIHLRLARERGRLDSLGAQLSHLSPLEILDRGYAIVQDDKGQIVKEAEAAPVDSSLDVRLAKGRLRAQVTKSIPGGNSGLPS
jgi:exodeoxyribonuclease VII large subunit